MKIRHALAASAGRVRFAVWAMMIAAAVNAAGGSFDFVMETSLGKTNVGFRVYDAANIGVSWDGGVRWEAPVSGANVLLSTNYPGAGLQTVCVTGKASRIAFYGTGCTPGLLRDITSPLSDGLAGINSARDMFRECTGITAFSCPGWFDAASSNVTTLWGMFQLASNFNCPGVTNWNTSKVTLLRATFDRAAAFNQDISTKTVNAGTPEAYTAWDVSKVTDFGQYNSLQWGMFHGATAFNQPIGNWDTSSAIYMDSTFFGAKAFNQDIGGWDTRNVTIMRFLFRDAAAFDQNLGAWNTAKVTDMQLMFAGATSFNNGGSDTIGDWDVSAATTLFGMFLGAVNFNQPIGRWNTSKVVSMRGVFHGATLFNQDISTKTVNAGTPEAYTAWDVSNVTDFGLWANNCYGTFYKAAAFNQPIGNWNVSKAATMHSMFRDATDFNQNLSSWVVTNVSNFSNIFLSSGLSGTNYSKLLVGWSQLDLKDGLAFHGGSGTYNLEGAGGKVTIIRNHGWSFTDGKLEVLPEYGVTSPMELQGCAMHPDKSYVLANDIDFSGTASWNGGAGLWPIGTAAEPFTGVFDGQGHVLSGLTISRPGLDGAGLFGYLAGTVRRLGVAGSVAGGEHVGGLFGKLVFGGLVEDAYARVAVTADAADRHRGGLGGRNEQGIVRRAYATGAVLPAVGSNGGGLVGSIDGGGAFEDTATFWDTESSGWSTSAMGAGRTTAQMRNLGTYAGWSIKNSYERLNDGYPFLTPGASPGGSLWRLFSSGGTTLLVR